MDDLNKSVKYWLNGSAKDLDAAESLLEKGFYSHSLFFCHLSLEKFLKALVIKKTGKFAPFIHDLRRLAELADAKIESEQKQNLDEISIFNIAGRYAEEKFDFYKKYNKKSLAKKYLKIANDLILCLKKELPKK